MSIIWTLKIIVKSTYIFNYRVADPMIYLIFGCRLGANGMETMETMDIIDKFPPKK